MHRPLLVAALVVATPALGSAQTATTDTAPVLPAEALTAPADALLPDAVVTDAVPDDESARRLAAFYARHADLLQAEADGDTDAFAIRLDALVADVRAAADRPGALADERFRALYASVMTEQELFYGEPVLDRGGVFALRSAGVEAVERGFDSGTPLLEHVTLPDHDTFVATIPMDVNEKVNRYVQFLLNRPSHVQRLRQRADTYFPMVERILAEEGVPDEVKYLAMVESALNPTARSHAAAVGMWQFIRPTGRAYGLRAERDIDDRMNPEAATRAAARHLRDLYDRFGDWQLALAGYNCNPAVVARGVRRFEQRTGQRATFWDIDHVIPRETRAYVPMFIATSLILSNPDAYGFDAHEPGPAYVFDRIPVAGGTRLSQVARILAVDTEVLSALNPSLRRSRVPDVRTPHMLRIPFGTYAENADALDQLAPAEAGSDQFAAESVSFGVRANRPLAPQEPFEAAMMVAERRELRRSLQPQTRVRRDDPVRTYVAEAPAAVADAEAQVAAARAAEAAASEPAPQVAMAMAPPVAPKAAPPASPIGQDTTPAPADDKPAPAEDDIVTDDLVLDAPAVEVAAVQPAVIPEPSGPTDAPPVRTVSSAPEVRTHQVQRGEYLTRIARDYGMTLAELRALNPGVGDALEIGQTLRVSGAPAAPVAARPTPPRRPTTHRVSSGENLTQIARRYGLTVRQLRQWNGLSSDVIRVGQRLRLRAGGSRG
ncbi:MAG: LysM peptidoglycan-binding domain-containing protein [Bacteroidota bacterium]